MKPRVLTQYSSHAHTIADTFRAAFLKTKLGDYLVDMTAPEESTQGGKLALQHVTLKPEAGGMTLVIGTVNAAEKRVELRTFAHVSKVHNERFKKPPPFEEAEYQALLDKADPVLTAFGLEVKVTDAGADDAKRASVRPAAPTEEKQGRPRIAIVGLVVGVLLIGAAIYLAVR
jgi:hypothetical protein